MRTLPLPWSRLVPNYARIMMMIMRRHTWWACGIRERVCLKNSGEVSPDRIIIIIAKCLRLLVSLWGVVKRYHRFVVSLPILCTRSSCQRSVTNFRRCYTRQRFTYEIMCIHNKIVRTCGEYQRKRACFHHFRRKKAAHYGPVYGRIWPRRCDEVCCGTFVNISSATCDDVGSGVRARAQTHTFKNINLSS